MQSLHLKSFTATPTSQPSQSVSIMCLALHVTPLFLLPPSIVIAHLLSLLCGIPSCDYATVHPLNHKWKLEVLIVQDEVGSLHLPMDSRGQAQVVRLASEDSKDL